MPKIKLKKLFRLAKSFSLIEKVAEKISFIFFKNLIFKKLLYISNSEKSGGLYE
jgi:hypothetical protein